MKTVASGKGFAARAVRLLAVAVIAACSSPAQSPPDSAAPDATRPAQPFQLRWGSLSEDATDQRRPVEVAGLPKAAVRSLEAAADTPAWNRILSVYASQGSPLADIDLPPMLGTYAVDEGVLRFTPRFPLEPGVTYRAVFRPHELPGADASSPKLVEAVHKVPERKMSSTAVVTQIYPTAGLLPENLLKFYIHFSRSMSRGHIYEYISLLDGDGKRVELPFLELDEELWNPEMTRLTLFIDPGRIKRGVRPLEEIGPSLEEGRRFTLVIDRAWRDGTGAPLKESFRKSFRVGPPDRSAPDPAGWKIKPPAAGTRHPLVIHFTDPMDNALAQRMIQILDSASAHVEGEVTLTNHERQWNFVPEAPWKQGSCKLVIQTIIEDLAGNNIGKPFEVDIFETVERTIEKQTVSIAFSVR